MAVENQSWLLFAGDLPVGVLELVLEPGCLFIYSVAVEPAWQGQGLGRRLLAWAEEQSRLAGRRTIRLYTNERFESNIRLYTRLGYRRTRLEPYLGSMLVHMEKQV